MRISLRKVGNSRGIIIPSGLLAACGMEDELDIRLEDGQLILAPVRAPRAGWFEGYKPEEDTEALSGVVFSEDGDEWEW